MTRAEEFVVVAPGDATGAALTRFVERVRTSAARGAVVIDDTACRSWSPGQHLVLERLQQLAARSRSRGPGVCGGDR